MDCTRRDAPVNAAVRVLINLGATRQHLHNVLAARDCLRFIHRESLPSEFDRLRCVSYLVVLRLQSEDMPIALSCPSDSLLSRAWDFAKSAIGMRRIGNEDRHVPRLTFRKNTRAVAIALRPSFCADGWRVPRALCPVHAFWASVSADAQPGGFLPPSLRSRNVSRILRRSLPNACVSGGNRYTPHCFRMGIANEILRPRSALSTIIREGVCSSGGYRAYLSLRREAELNMQNSSAHHPRTRTQPGAESLSSESSTPRSPLSPGASPLSPSLFLFGPLIAHDTP